MAEYIFEVKVTKVDKASVDDLRTVLKQGRSYTTELSEAIETFARAREVSEVAHFTVKAPHLPGGIKKAQSHLDLLGD